MPARDASRGNISTDRMLPWSRASEPRSQQSAPIPPRSGDERACFEPESKNRERLAEKQTGHKTIRNSAQKMRPDISSTVECSYGKTAKIPNHVPSRDRHDAFDESHGRD